MHAGQPRNRPATQYHLPPLLRDGFTSPHGAQQRAGNRCIRVRITSGHYRLDQRRLDRGGVQ